MELTDAVNAAAKAVGGENASLDTILPTPISLKPYRLIRKFCRYSLIMVWAV